MVDAVVAGVAFIGLVYAAYFVGSHLSDLLAERVFGKYR